MFEQAHISTKKRRSLWLFVLKTLSHKMPLGKTKFWILSLNSNSKSRHKLPNSQQVATTSLHKKEQSFWLRSFIKTKNVDYNIAATLRISDSRAIKRLSLRAACILYLVCILVSISASMPKAASKQRARASVTGRFPFSISFNIEYDTPICCDSIFCDMPLYSISSFITSPGCVGVYG